MGCDLSLEPTDYLVITDQSIWPFADEITEKGLFYPEEAKVTSFPR